MTRSNLNTSYHSLQKVQRHLDENKLHVHKVRPKDKHNYKSNTYQVWYLVYDSNHLPVQYFYQCKGCDVLAKFKLSNGNYQMRRHPCFQAWLKNHEAQKKKTLKLANNDDVSDEDASNADRSGGDEDSDHSESSSGDEKNYNDESKSGRSHGSGEGNVDTVGKLIERFSEICKENGKITAIDATQFAPKSWTVEDWYMLAFL